MSLSHQNALKENRKCGISVRDLYHLTVKSTFDDFKHVINLSTQTIIHKQIIHKEN